MPLYFNAGGGSRSAAKTLKTVVEEQQRPWHVRLFNLQGELESLDIFKKITGIRLPGHIQPDAGERMDARALNIWCRRCMESFGSIPSSSQVKMLTEIWRRDKPDMVVSVVPNFNRALFQSVQERRFIHTSSNDPDGLRRLSSALLVGASRTNMSSSGPSAPIGKRSSRR